LDRSLIRLFDIGHVEASEGGVGVALRETRVTEAPDRGAEHVEWSGSWEDQAVDQDRIEMSQNDPFGTARGADERAEEIRVEPFGTQPARCLRSGTDD